jgi:hypothetical protein
VRTLTSLDPQPCRLLILLNMSTFLDALPRQNLMRFKNCFDYVVSPSRQCDHNDGATRPVAAVMLYDQKVGSAFCRLAFARPQHPN